VGYLDIAAFHIVFIYHNSREVQSTRCARTRDTTRTTRRPKPFQVVHIFHHYRMLRRAPTTTDGKLIDRHQESTRISKPFKTPTLVVQRAQPQRRRKRVSYKEAQADDDDTDSDSGSKSAKRRKSTIETGNPASHTYQFPVYKPKPFNELFGPRRYTIPVMTNKNGEIVKIMQSNPSLGIRPQVKIIPRPLHDPMEDHAIVLYDPTIDTRETDEERRAREKEALRAQAEKEAREKTTGLFNPHKSLRELLGGGKEKKVHQNKVPVVIDPRLSKVLRPHQVEGVKVRALS
jgi:DNA repair and recombination protein RAD54 and RAD54-like protein